MKTKCYCICCPKHPKFKARHKLGTPVTDYEVGDSIDPDFQHQGAVVSCLKPYCGAIKNGIIEPNDYNFPVTAYGNGYSHTGFRSEIDGLACYATCIAERYKQ